ncbi:MAG: 50S ribosomal protein L18 [Phycisphaerales bacterium]|nr:50S ribosomal protein L18 [Phycisphaerales bacterium]
MNRSDHRIQRRLRRKKGIRAGLMGHPDRPRLSVFRSSKHIYAQVIDDLSGRTLVSASTAEKDSSGYGGNKDAATNVGQRLAARAKEAGVQRVVFDRNGYQFHGRVKCLADGCREGGLEF